MNKKNNYQFALLLFILLSANSCKSSSRLTHREKTLQNILALDLLANKESIDSKAIIVNEEVSSSVAISQLSPWRINRKDYEGPKSSSISDGPYTYWQIHVRTTIKVLVDDISDKSFAEITYWEPNGSYSTLIKDIKCWVSEMGEEGIVTKNALTKDQIQNIHLNDSTHKVTFKIDGNLNGKILDYEYTVLSPYYSLIPTKFYPDVALIPIHTFQRDIPVISAQYEIELPSFEHDAAVLKNEVKQVGEGKLEIKKDKGNGVVTFSQKSLGVQNTPTTVRADYSYETYTITAEDIPAYIDSKNTSGEPLGVQIIRTGQQFVP